MLFKVDFKSGLPVYLQLVEQVRYAAASGSIAEGELLPSIRPLAEDLRVNRNTVAKAYAELERIGLVETVPGKGCFLRTNGKLFSDATRLQVLQAKVDDAAVTAHQLQIDDTKLLKLVRERYQHFRSLAVAEGGSPSNLTKKHE